MNLRRPAGLLLFAALTASPAAALARDYAKQADEAADASLPAVTIFVDADWGGREDGAARELTRAHKDFGARGFHVVDVESFVENGDLQGFFVTYQRTR
jgi:hypothetical protein